MGSRAIVQQDYTDEILAPLNQHKLLISLRKAFGTEFKLLKKALPRVLSHNLPRAGQ